MTWTNKVPGLNNESRDQRHTNVYAKTKKCQCWLNAASGDLAWGFWDRQSKRRSIADMAMPNIEWRWRREIVWPCYCRTAIRDFSTWVAYKAVGAVTDGKWPACGGVSLQGRDRQLCGWESDNGVVSLIPISNKLAIIELRLYHS
jgi:hypothetical protein